jgi:hypothetical protein
MLRSMAIAVPMAALAGCTVVCVQTDDVNVGVENVQLD